MPETIYSKRFLAFWTRKYPTYLPAWTIESWYQQFEDKIILNF